MTAIIPATRPAAQPSKAGGDGLRPDIQALRALAVGSVLLYHLWPDRVTGGYVGVDVFFVISGFLITSHLLREVAKTGTVRVGNFWARRAKRLLPASLTVLLAVAVGVVAFVPEALWKQFLGEVIASTLYVENWLLAANSVDYLALENAPSPTQHFWTLSVEEQFYVALPLIMIAVILIARRLGRGVVATTRIVGIVLATAVAASFVYSVVLTATTPSVAYFSTLTRAWEFGAGAVLAFVSVRAGRRTTAVVPVLGVGLILLACVLYTAATPFPGAAAALPVLGTVLVLWAGRASVVSRVGGWWPVATLGYISYAVYLWHWPLVVLTPYVTERPLSTLEKVLILIATLLLAWLSTRFIEEPVRFSPRLLGGARRPRSVALWSAAGMAVVTMVSFGGIAAVDARAAEREALLSSIIADAPACLGAQAMDPALAPCDNPDLPDELLPDPANAKADDDNLSECWQMENSTDARMCTVVEPTSYSKRLIAIGDSHNNTLIGAYRSIGESQGWRVDVAGAGGCYLTTAEQQAKSDEQREECVAWRASVAAQIAADPPDAIIVTHSSGDHLVVPGPGQDVRTATVDGMVEAWTSLPDVPIIAIRDNPAMTNDTATCVAREGLSAAQECARPRADALGNFDGQAEAAARVPNARIVDMTDFYCTDEECAPVIGNVLVYRDPRHITSTWAHTLAPYLEREIVDALAWRR